MGAHERMACVGSVRPEAPFVDRRGRAPPGTPGPTERGSRARHGGGSREASSWIRLGWGLRSIASAAAARAKRRRGSASGGAALDRGRCGASREASCRVLMRPSPACAMQRPRAKPLLGVLGGASGSPSEEWPRASPREAAPRRAREPSLEAWCPRPSEAPVACLTGYEPPRTLPSVTGACGARPACARTTRLARSHRRSPHACVGARSARRPASSASRPHGTEPRANTSRMS